MFYESELRLVRDTFRKCQVQTSIDQLSAPPDSSHSLGLYTLLINSSLAQQPLEKILPPVNKETVYSLKDPLSCKFHYFRLPEFPAEAILVIGPYLTSPLSSSALMEWAEAQNISPDQQKHLESYYTTIPVLSDAGHLLALLDAFVEHLWGSSGYTMEDLSGDSFVISSFFTEKKAPSEEEDTLWRMKDMEQRYAFENELMDAVSKGQYHKAEILLHSVSSSAFEQRLADSLRNAKNYCIIMNTLLRKAAEKGGVHPIYMDSLSSNYALRIEQLVTTEDIAPLMTEMFRAYCRLVRKYTISHYSPLIQQAIVFIDSNLADNLSLNALSKSLNISSSYLSTLFKKETGQTLTDFIVQRRIGRAKELLSNTRLQIQTIAQHCGIFDIHYFSKIFKRIVGQTPKAFRESQKT